MGTKPPPKRGDVGAKHHLRRGDWGAKPPSLEIPSSVTGYVFLWFFLNFTPSFPTGPN